MDVATWIRLCGICSRSNSVLSSVKKENHWTVTWLTVSSSGAKLRPDGDVPAWKKGLWAAPQDGIDGTGFTVSTLAGILQRMLQAPVIDRTGLRGSFDYKVEWKRPSPGALPDPAELKRALEEQLGLRLEAKPVTVDVINVVSLKSPEQVLTAR